MRTFYFHTVVWCLLLLTVACVCAEDKTADKLWEDYRDVSQNANTASDNYHTQVRAAKEASRNLKANKKTFTDSTKSTIQNVFAAAGLYAVGAPTIFIPALGQVKPTLDMVKSWFEKGNLEALKVFADQAASDAHRKSVKRDKEKSEAYTAYTTRYKKENPTGTPKPPLDDSTHEKYNFSCPGGCGESWDTVEVAKLTHQLTCPGGSAAVPGCGKTYYLREAIRDLPPMRRRVFGFLYYHHEMPIKAIAGFRLKRSEGTVKTHLRNARLQLQEHLTPYLKDEDITWLA